MILSKEYVFSYSCVCDLSEEEKSDIAALWHEVFGDSHNFISFMLNSVLSESYVFSAKNGSFLCSILFLVGIPYNYEGKNISSFYLYAAATAKQHRGKGLFSSLFSIAEVVAKEFGAQFIFCKPAESTLFGFYERFCFETTTFCETFYIKPENKGYNFRESDIKEQYYEIYLANISDKKSALVKSKKQFISSLECALCEENTEFFVSEGAYALVRYEKDGAAVVFDISSAGGAEKDAASSLLFKLSKNGRLIMPSFSGEPYCMAKPLSDKKCVFTYCSLMFE